MADKIVLFQKHSISKNISVLNSMLDDCNTAAANIACVLHYFYCDLWPINHF